MEKVIAYETRVLRSMACLRALRWRLDIEDVRRFPASIQCHGGVVCREAARRLAAIENRNWRNKYYRQRDRESADMRRERVAAGMREKYGRVQGRRRAA